MAGLLIYQLKMQMPPENDHLFLQIFTTLDCPKRLLAFCSTAKLGQEIVVILYLNRLWLDDLSLLIDLLITAPKLNQA